jgi:D-arabinonate dehydratase
VGKLLTDGGALLVDRVDAVALRLPLASPISSALGVYTHVDCTVVHVTTTDGIRGVGFNAGLGGAASAAIVPYIEQELAPLAVGQDVRAIDSLWHRMWGPNKARQRAGLGVWALSAVDIALWDVLGKASGQPVHVLLGGYRSNVPVYGSGGWHSLTDDELVAEAERFAGLGITAYKYKIGTERDEERTRLLRSTLGDDYTLLADANQKYSVREAIEVSHMLADHGVAWIEEPVLADTVDDLAEVAAAASVPTAAGENTYFRWGFREICDRRAASYLQPDVARCGGISEFRRIAALADSYNLALSSHLWHELSIGLVGASPSGWMAEYAPLIPDGALTREFPVVDGAISVPDVPGHGVEFTAEALARFVV